MTEPIRVLLVDDDRLVRAAIGLILNPLPDIDIVAEAVNGREAIDLALRHRPNVVLLDVRMPVMDGIAALSEIRRVSSAAVLLLTTFGEAGYIAAALAGGAAGFLVKDSAVEELARAVRAAANGDAYLSPSVTRHVIDRFPSGPHPSAALANRRIAALTGRERDVLLLLAQGLSNATIAERLWISEATVKTHVSRLLSKLDCENRVQAALLVHQAGRVT